MNHYVRNERIRRADTSAFAPSYLFDVCVFVRVHAYLCNKHTKHGSQYVT